MARPRKPERHRKSVMVNFRVDPEFKKKLDAAAKNAGRSLSEEIDIRVRGTALLEKRLERIKADFGPETFALFVLARRVIRDLEVRAGTSWLQNPYMHNLAVKIVTYVLEQVKPPGDPVRPAGLERQGEYVIPDDYLAAANAGAAFCRVLQGSDTPFIPRSLAGDYKRLLESDEGHIFDNWLRSWLAPVVERLNPKFGPASEDSKEIRKLVESVSRRRRVK